MTVHSVWIFDPVLLATLLFIFIENV